MNWALIALPGAIWLVLRLVLANQARDFDFDTGHGTFAIFLGTYLKFVGAMVAVGLGMALLGKWQHEPDGIVLMCLAGAAYAFLFALHLTVRYELYLHSRYPRMGGLGPSTYSVSQYALTHALGWSAVIFTAIGTIMAVLLAWES